MPLALPNEIEKSMIVEGKEIGRSKTWNPDHLQFLLYNHIIFNFEKS